MVAIMKYENGLKFTGMVANTMEEAKDYLANLHGREEEFPAYPLRLDENNKIVYEKKFVPYYPEGMYEIIDVKII